MRASIMGLVVSTEPSRQQRSGRPGLVWPTPLYQVLPPQRNASMWASHTYSTSLISPFVCLFLDSWMFVGPSVDGVVISLFRVPGSASLSAARQAVFVAGRNINNKTSDGFISFTLLALFSLNQQQKIL